MTAIAGASVSVRTMVDGTLRITVDVEPKDAQAAFALFGTPGRGVALAALVDGSGAVAEPKKEREHLGDLCYRATQWCRDPEFIKWVNSRTFAGILWHIKDEKECVDFIKEYIGVESRKELDTEPAKTRFMEWIVMPWRQHNAKIL